MSRKKEREEHLHMEEKVPFVKNGGSSLKKRRLFPKV